MRYTAPMKLATFNVNSLKIRLPIVLDWLAAHSPDVLMLQELKTTELPLTELNAAGYQVQAVPQKTYNGVAILTKEPAILVHTRLPGMEDDEQARFIAVDYPGLRIINIYAPNGNPVDTEKYPYKHRWLGALYDHLATLRRARIDTVIAGDFNIIPESYDAAHPNEWVGDALFQPETRAQYRAMLNLGFTDAVRALHPAPAPHYTFWDYQAGSWRRNNGIRIDHVLLSPRLADKLRTADVDAAPRGLEKPSDHTPVMIEIDL